MDEFNNLDAELEKLRAELNMKDELGKIKFTGGGDYWKSRLDEERILWEKKAALRDEERKAFDKKLQDQDGLIRQYEQKFAEIERRFDADRRQLEDRLRAKEADLLIEKNRILSEEKVREAEFENKRLLAKIADLNAELARAKDEQVKAAEKLEGDFGRERAALDERIKAEMTGIELLRARAGELEAAVAARETALTELKGKCASAEQKIEQYVKNTTALSAAIEQGAHAAEEERQKTARQFRENVARFVTQARAQLGPLAGLARFAARHRPSAGTARLFAELVERAAGETERFAVEANAVALLKETAKIALCLDEVEEAAWKAELGAAGAEVLVLSPKGIVEELATAQPRVLVVAAGRKGVIRTVSRCYPFLPLVLVGDLPASKAGRYLAAGYRLVASPASEQERVKAAYEAARGSVALPAYWGRVSEQRSYVRPVAVAAIAAVTAALLYAFVPFGPSAGNTEYATPYPRPTNIAFDGKDLWACDWLGQSVYRHASAEGMKLNRVLYYPGRHFAAITWANGTMYSVDGWENRIYRHGKGEGLPVEASFPAPGPGTTGLASDGKFLWSCDRVQGAIRRHVFDGELTVEATYRSPGTSPSGLYFDGRDLWSSDSQTNRVYRHNPDDTLSVAESFIPAASVRADGIVRMKDQLWICSEKTGRIVSIPLRSLAKAPKADN